MNFNKLPRVPLDDPTPGSKVGQIMCSRLCAVCCGEFAERCFRRNHSECIWCQFADQEFRAEWRYRDKCKHVRWSASLDRKDFVDWYLSQPDQCAYCGVTYAQLKKLCLPRLKGYYVSWDIDRKDSSRPYELGNLALACFYCNVAKSNYLDEAEAKIVGRAIGEVYRSRLSGQHASD